MARRHWPGEDPDWKRIYVPGPANFTAPLTIVGVVADLRQADWTSDTMDEVFLPHAQRAGEFGLAAMTFVLRTAGDADTVAAALPRVLLQVDRAVPISDVTTMAGVVRDELWRQRVSAQLTATFAVVALGLAILGVHAVVAYSATRRAREFGIRVALGASAAHVRRLALWEAMRPALAGALAGVAGAWLAARWLQSQLPDVGPLDPAAIAGAAAALLTTAMLAAWVPASRAGRRDPSAALRQE
jgi:ABC-type antimicrobial peptide transport system permease subunit